MAVSLKRPAVSGKPGAARLLLYISAGLLVLGAAAVLSVYLYANAEADRRSFLKSHARSTVIADRAGEPLADIPAAGGELGYWPVEGPIPRVIINALLAAEDKAFFHHGGVDYRALARAFTQNWTMKRRVSGASTLTMQVVRMEYPAPRNYFQKFIEILAAQKMYRRYGRETILRHYLTVAPFGPNYRGITFAAYRYFRKPLTDITPAEASLLVSIPQSPSRFDLHSPSGFHAGQERARYVLARMLTNGTIIPAEAGKALKMLSLLCMPPRLATPLESIHAVLAIKKACPESMNGGVFISSLDSGLQKQAAGLSRAFLNRFTTRGAGNLACIVLSARTGEVLAYCGSGDYYSEKGKGGIDYAQVPRSSGSTIKPFLYALGIETGLFNGASVLSDVSTSFYGERSIYTPANADRSYLGPVLYRYALANSRNIPAVQVLDTVGPGAAYSFFQKLGLVAEPRGALYYGLGLAIGGLTVRLTDLTAAYGVLANDGREFHLTWHARKDHQRISARRIIDPGTARLISMYLADPMARIPSFPRLSPLEYPFPVSIKTGTSQGYRDAWTVAYTRDYIVGVWVGDPDFRRMDSLTGGASSAYLVRGLVELLHPLEMKGRKGMALLPPDGYISRQICKISGKLANEWTPDSVTEWFKPGQEPLDQSGVFRLVNLDRRTMTEADATCPPEYIEKKVVASLPPEYAEWAKASGLTLAGPSGTGSGLNTEGDEDSSIVLIEPRDGTHLLYSSEIPPERQTIALKAEIQPAIPQAVWYVNGKPYQVADYPYTVRWKITRGRHTFQVRYPYTGQVSRMVTVTVD